jgi:hypothetical protein
MALQSEVRPCPARRLSPVAATEQIATQPHEIPVMNAHRVRVLAEAVRKSAWSNWHDELRHARHDRP